MRKKVGICTLYDNENIGNRLQNYAVQFILEQMGCQTETLPIVRVYGKRAKLKQWLQHLCTSASKREQQKRKQKRKRAITAFTEEYIHLGQPVNKFDLPKDLKDRYDYFVTGSDQVWRNWSEKKEDLDFYMLRFCERSQRIALAPSFGKDEITTNRDLYVEGLKGFDHLSVREQSGQRLIEQLTGQQARVLLDPTMFVDVKQWCAIEKRPDWLPQSKYMVIYSLSEIDPSVQMYLKRFESEYMMIELKNPKIESWYNTRPDEFLYLIHHASLVVTDSFHACVFSILYHTDFIVYERQLKNSMFSRIETLMKTFGLTDRIFTNMDPNAWNHTDFTGVASVLEKEREKAKAFIERSLR